MRGCRGGGFKEEEDLAIGWKEEEFYVVAVVSASVCGVQARRRRLVVSSLLAHRNDMTTFQESFSF